MGTAERTLRWCRRNPGWATAIVLGATLLCGIALLSLWYSSRLRVQLERAQLAEQSQRNAYHSAQAGLWDSYMTEVASRNGSRRIGQRFAALQTIDKATSLLDSLERSDERMVQLRSAILSSVALPDMRTLAAWPTDAYLCDAAPAADCYVVGKVTGEIIGYRLSNGEPLWSIEGVGQPTEVSLSPNGRFVAATTSANTHLWRIDGGTPQAMYALEGARNFTFSADRAHAAISRPSLGMQLIELATGNLVRALDEGEPVSPFAIHPQTSQIAMCTRDRLKIISSDSGEMIWELPIEPTAQAQLAWHPSGQYLAAWTDSNEIVLWDVRRQVKLYALSHRGNPTLLVFNDDGSALASYSSWDQRLLVWQVADGQRLLEVPGINCRAARAVEAGSIWILGETANHVVLSDFRCGLRRALSQAIHRTMGYWNRASIGPEGRIVVVCSGRGLELWDLQSSHRLASWPIGDCNADFDSQGRLLVGCRHGIYRFPRRVELFLPGGEANESALQTTVNLGPPETLAEGIVPTTLATEPSGQSMAYADRQGWAAIHAESNSAVRFKTVLDPRKAAVSPDHRYVAIANWDNPGAAVWNAATGEHLANLAIGLHGIVEFSPDGRWLAATPDGVTLWQVGNWQRRAELRAVGTTPTGLGIAFSADSRVLVVGESNGVLRIVDTNTMSDWARLSHPTLNVTWTMAFSPDQRLLVTSSIDERAAAEVWDLEGMLQELSHLGLMDRAGILPALTRSATIDGPLRVTINDSGLLTPIDEPSTPAPDPR